MKPRDIEFKGMVEGRKHSDGRQIYRAVATTPALDRYGEVVLPRGAMIDNFMKNPVLAELHNYQRSSIGQVIDIQIEEKQVLFDFVFSTDSRGQELEKKYQDGDMRAFSIGFRGIGILKLWYPWEDQPEDLREVSVTLPDGSTASVDLSAYEHVPYRIYHKWELLEISPVTVPANPEALLLKEAEDIVRRAAAADPITRHFVQEEVEEVYAPLIKALEDFEARMGGADFKVAGVVPKHSCPVVEVDWDKTVAKAELAKWASKKNTGKKEDMNWAKYRKGFAQFDPSDMENFRSYKLVHHTVKDGELVVVWKGLTLAMSALLRADNTVDGGDREAAYEHLGKHYKDFGKTPPVFKEYTEEELKSIEAEELKAVEGETLGGSTVTDPPEVIETGTASADHDKVISLLTQLAGAIKDLGETVQEGFISTSIKLSVIGDVVEAKQIKKDEVKEKGVVEDFTVSRDTLDALDRLAVSSK